MKILTIVFAFFVLLHPSYLKAAIVIDGITESESDSLLSTELVIANAILKAGHGSTWEIASGKNTGIDSPGKNVSWEIGDPHTISLEYDFVGNYSLDVTPPSSSTTTTEAQPINWFNQLLVRFTTVTDVSTTFSGSIDGQSFPTIATPSNGFGGMLITFTDNSASNVDEFLLSALFTPFAASTPNYDDFRGEFYLIQNSAIPEPSSILLLISGLLIMTYLQSRTRTKR